MTPSVPENVPVLTVSQLTEQVKLHIESGFPAVWVEGEIVNCKIWQSGHIYFDLRDGTTKVNAVMFRGSALRLPAGFTPQDGVHVIAKGRMSVYAQRGEYQLIVERMFPKGQGAQELALKQLKEKLNKLGYFDQKRKRRLPTIPRCVCLIASAQGAAVGDLIKILGARWPATRVLVRPSRVQGDGAAEEVALAIQQVNRWTEAKHIDPEVIIVARGGGGIEDLWAFNQEPVAQAIFHSKLPIVSAIGHEIDVTIADLVADVRASTPSNAAELVVPDRRELLGQAQDLGGRLVEAMRRDVRWRRERLDDLAERRVLKQPLERIRELERRLDDWDERLMRSVRQRITHRQRSVEAMAGRLGGLSPLNVLARGYSLTQTETPAEIVRSADQIKIGDRLITTLHHGRVLSRVESTEPGPKSQK